jgi:hypothetical protein
MASRKQIAAERRERRRLARERLAALRRELREARERRKQAAFDARERCRSERLALRERLRTQRMRVLQELRDTARLERETLRAACAARRAEVRAIRDEVARARAKVAAERQEQAEVRRLERAERARLTQAPACVTCRAETDDEVLANIPSELAPLFERVRRSIKGSGRMSRSEEFLRYAEAHPDEVLVTSKHEADERVRELERQHRELAKEAGAKVNPYEARKAARIERMRARADRLSAAAQGAYASAKQIADMIPMGQPILVGHHSEGRHRRDMGRIQGGFSKAFNLQEQAEQLQQRAERAERSDAVSSDDPDAIPKLRAKLEQLEADRARMVAANKAVRSKEPREALAALGFSPDAIDKLLTRDPLGNLGFPAYALRNAAGEAARLRKRIAELEARANRPAPPPAVQAPGVRIEEADNRVRIVFDAKPPEAVRSALKSTGFRWAPSVGAWQRQASNAAWNEAKRIVGVGGAVPAPAPATPLHGAHVGRPANQNALTAGGPLPAEVERIRALEQKPQPAVKGEGLDTAEIAALIRQDIKEAVKRGQLPKAKYSVRTDRYSMGSSIDVVVSGLPFPVINPDAFIVQPGASWVTFDSSRYRSRFTPAAQEVERKLNAIIDAYHWDKSDSMTDYYHERFARNVRLTEDAGDWKRMEAAKVAAARAAEDAARKEVHP